MRHEADKVRQDLKMCNHKTAGPSESGYTKT
jgi:hypothetical protein